MTTPKCNRSDVLDEAVDAFESALAVGDACDLSDFLPDRSAPEYLPILLELVRVDLENSWRFGRCRKTEDYCLDFPDVFQHETFRSQVAYEEYRVRLHTDAPISAAALAERLAISTDHWPKKPEGDSVSRSSTDHGTSFPAGAETRWRAIEAFPEFRVLTELGQGTFGCVYLAKQRGLAERLVAIKITADTTLEPERLAVLQHTAIVPIYSVHRTDTWQAMCMPFFGRATLETVLEEIRSDRLSTPGGLELMSRTKRRLLPANKAEELSTVPKYGFCAPTVSQSYLRGCFRVIADLASGLHHAHEHGILHRDIKPANILIADDGRPMLLDFNLSSDVGHKVSSSPVVGGTLPYMAPEQLKSLTSEEPIGPQADIYSLGVILFEMVTRKLPFPIPEERGDKHELLVQMIADRTPTEYRPYCVPSVRELNHNVSRSVAAVIERCLHPDPHKRYETAQQLSEDLSAELDHLPLQHTANPSWTERFDKWRRRNPRALSLSSLMAFACIATLLGMFGWTARERHLGELEARVAWEDFRVTSKQARTLLSAPGDSLELIDEGVKLATSALAAFPPEDETDSSQRDNLAYLSSNDRKKWQQTVGELSYLLASARLTQSRVATTAERRNELLLESLQRNQQAVQQLNAGSQTHALKLQQNAILTAMGDHPSHADFVPTASGVEPTDIDAYVSAAHSVAQGHADRVLNLLETLVGNNPDDYSIWFLNGQAMAQCDKLAAADAAFTTCIAFQRSCWRAWLERGIVRQRLTQYDRAENDFSQVIAARPDIAAAWVNRALVRQSTGRFSEAISDLDRAIDLDGPSRCWFLRANCHRELGSHDAAQSDFATGLATEPHDSVSWVARGVAQLRLSPTQALADFETALRFNPCSMDALQNIAHVQSEFLKNPEAAIHSLDRAVDLRPQNTQAIASRAVLHARQQNTPAALHDAGLAMKLPCTPLETYQIACVYALLPEDEGGSNLKALNLLKQALRKDVLLARMMVTDPDLARLQEMNEFRKLMAATVELQAAR